MIRYTLQVLHPILQNEKLLHSTDFADMIRVIGTLSRAWRGRLNAVGEESILFRWDSVIGNSGAHM